MGGDPVGTEGVEQARLGPLKAEAAKKGRQILRGEPVGTESGVAISSLASLKGRGAQDEKAKLGLYRRVNQLEH